MKESELWHKKILENKDYFKNKLGQSRLRHSSLNFRELERSHTVKNYESKCLWNSKQVLCWFACFTVSSNTLRLESFKCLRLCTFSHSSMIWEIYVIPMYFLKKLSVNLLFPYIYLFHVLAVLFALSLVFFFFFPFLFASFLYSNHILCSIQNKGILLLYTMVSHSLLIFPSKFLHVT